MFPFSFLLSLSPFLFSPLLSFSCTLQKPPPQPSGACFTIVRHRGCPSPPWTSAKHCCRAPPPSFSSKYLWTNASGRISFKSYFFLLCVILFNLFFFFCSICARVIRFILFLFNLCKNYSIWLHLVHFFFLQEEPDDPTRLNLLMTGLGRVGLEREKVKNRIQPNPMCIIRFRSIFRWKPTRPVVTPTTNSHTKHVWFVCLRVNLSRLIIKQVKKNSNHKLCGSARELCCIYSALDLIITHLHPTSM